MFLLIMLLHQKGAILTNFKKSQDWNHICKLWNDNEKNGKYRGKLNKMQFLQSDDTGNKFGNHTDPKKRKSEVSSFSQN